METPTAPPPVRRRRESPPAEPTDGHGRLPLAAGHVVVVLVVGLVLGALLNADGLRRSAELREQGWEREVALALTRPLTWFSGVTLLDQPREAIRDAIGRGDENATDGPAFQAEDGPPPLPTTTDDEPRDRPVFTAAHRARLLVAGDSLVVVPGQSIISAAESTGVVRAVAPVDARIATGLARPDVFDWYGHLRRELPKRKPDVVVLSFGGNDDKDVLRGLPEGVALDGFGNPAWVAEYRRRVEAVMDLVSRHVGLLVWIGLPLTGDSEQTRRFEVLNGIAHDAAAERPGRVEFLDTYTMFADDDGGYSAYLTTDDGARVLVRGSDGVHFERAGGDLIADEFMRRLREAFDLRES